MKAIRWSPACAALAAWCFASLFSSQLFAAGATLSGRLIDDVSRQPVGTATYVVTGDPVSRGVNRFGRFNVLDVPGGTVEVTFAASGYHPKTARYSVVPMVSQDVGDVLLERIVAARLPDLAVAMFDVSGVSSDADTLTVSGNVQVAVTNQGAQDVSSDFEVLLFEDIDGDGRYSAATDQAVGRVTLSGGLGMGQTRALTVPVSGTLRYRDAPLRLFIDSGNAVTELDKANNIDRYGTGPGYASQTYTEAADFDQGRKINVAVDRSREK